jgi:phosphoribosylanthranilate isomerase
MIRVKICGISNLKDALAAIEYGADALGFVFFSKSPRYIAPEKAKSIISSLPPIITTVGVFVDEEKKKLEEIVSFTGLDTIQLHGSEPPEYSNFNKKVIKAIRIKELSDLELLKRYNSVSSFLLDTYSPNELGGTGKVFNWEIAVEAKKYGKIILAGGLRPDNVAKAIEVVQPYGIDVSSGVEGNIKGRKDHKKIRLFIETARKASMEYA